MAGCRTWGQAICLNKINGLYERIYDLFSFAPQRFGHGQVHVAGSGQKGVVAGLMRVMPDACCRSDPP